MQWTAEISELLSAVEEVLSSADAGTPETGECAVPGELIAKLQQRYKGMMTALDEKSDLAKLKRSPHCDCISWARLSHEVIPGTLYHPRCPKHQN